MAFKYFGFIQLAAIVLLTSCQKEKENPDQSDSFIKYYGGSGSQRAFSVEQTAEGGFIFIGKTNSFSGSDDIYLVKTDKSGNEEWYKTYGGPGADEGTSVKVLPGGSGYILTGTIFSDNGKSDVYVAKVNPQGDEMRTWTFGNKDLNEQGMAIAVSPSEEFSIIGSKDSTDKEIFILKTEPDGNLSVWAPKIRGGIGNSIDDIPGRSVEDLGQRFVFAFSSRKDGLATPVVALYDKSSGVELNAPDDSQLDGPASNLATAVDFRRTSNGFVLTGMTEQSQIYLLNLTENFTSTLKIVLPLEHVFVQSIAPTSDGGYILAATESLPGNAPDIVMIKTDGNGNISWKKNFGGSGADEAFSVRQTFDGGYILAGTISFENNKMACLIKTDKDGQVKKTK